MPWAVCFYAVGQVTNEMNRALQRKVFVTAMITDVEDATAVGAHSIIGEKNNFFKLGIFGPFVSHSGKTLLLVRQRVPWPEEIGKDHILAFVRIIVKNKETESLLQRISRQMECEGIPGPIDDFNKKNDDEFFFRTDNGLFYSKLSASNVFIEQLFWRTLGQIEDENIFFDNESKMVLFRNQDMKHGIITDMFRILRISSTRPFESGDFFQMYGFCRDDEESGENGIDSGEEVIRILIRNIDKDNCPEIVFSIKATNYKTKKNEMKMVVFKNTGAEFEMWKEGKLISK